jgi:hypothetical protein
MGAFTKFIVTKNRFTMAAFSVFVLTGQAVQTD